MSLFTFDLPSRASSRGVHIACRGHHVVTLAPGPQLQSRPMSPVLQVGTGPCQTPAGVPLKNIPRSSEIIPERTSILPSSGRNQICLVLHPVCLAIHFGGSDANSWQSGHATRALEIRAHRCDRCLMVLPPQPVAPSIGQSRARMFHIPRRDVIMVVMKPEMQSIAFAVVIRLAMETNRHMQFSTSQSIFGGVRRLHNVGQSAPIRRQKVLSEIEYGRYCVPCPGRSIILSSSTTSSVSADIEHFRIWCTVIGSRIDQSSCRVAGSSSAELVEPAAASLKHVSGAEPRRGKVCHQAKSSKLGCPQSSSRSRCLATPNKPPRPTSL